MVPTGSNGVNKLLFLCGKLIVRDLWTIDEIWEEDYPARIHDEFMMYPST